MPIHPAGTRACSAVTARRPRLREARRPQDLESRRLSVTFVNTIHQPMCLALPVAVERTMRCWFRSSSVRVAEPRRQVLGGGEQHGSAYEHAARRYRLPVLQYR